MRQSPGASSQGPNGGLRASKEKFTESGGLLAGIKLQATDLQTSEVDEESDPMEDYESSESDDKTQPNFWRRTDEYETLPTNVKKAIDVGKLKAKHSQFYYRMKDLNHKITVYKQIFDSRIPAFQRAFMKKRLLAKQEKQQKARLQFEREMREIHKTQRKNLKRFQTAINVHASEDPAAPARRGRGEYGKQAQSIAGHQHQPAGRADDAKSKRGRATQSVPPEEAGRAVAGFAGALAAKLGVKQAYPPTTMHLGLKAEPGRSRRHRTSRTVNLAASDAGSRASKRVNNNQRTGAAQRKASHHGYNVDSAIAEESQRDSPSGKHEQQLVAASEEPSGRGGDGNNNEADSGSYREFEYDFREDKLRQKRKQSEDQEAKSRGERKSKDTKKSHGGAHGPE